MIRKADTNDITALVELSREFWDSGGPVDGFDEPHTRANLLKILDGNCIFVSVDDGVISGMLILIFSLHLCVPKINACELAWYVTPAARGGSSGAKLLKRAEEEAVSEGADTLTMAFMARSMPDVIKSMYEKLGFEFSEATYIKRLK